MEDHIRMYFLSAHRTQTWVIIQINSKIKKMAALNLLKNFGPIYKTKAVVTVSVTAMGYDLLKTI